MLPTGESSNNKDACIPFARDVTPFVKALLIARERIDPVHPSDGSSGSQYHGNLHDEQSNTTTGSDMVTETDDMVGQDFVRIGRRRNLIPLMNGKSMNAVFGDPCPGVSKRLNIHYIIYDDRGTDETIGKASRKHEASEVHRQNFAEHERVILSRRITFFQNVGAVADAAQRLAKASVSGQDDDEAKALRQARRMGRAQSVAEFAQSAQTAASRPMSVSSTSVSSSLSLSSTLTPLPSLPIPNKDLPESPKWRLRSATSEIILPIVLPYLEVRERVQCQLVCVVWRFVVRQWGVAQTVDVTDVQSIPNFSRPFLRGILAHSHHSLQSLFLSGYTDLAKEDLHLAIPHLRKLRTLDISRCTNLDNETMVLISEHVGSHLDVLYLKGLRKVTDEGIISICRRCQNLKVLEISDVSITDESGRMIGENLQKLNALYMRDNYRMTNQSIDIITQQCTRLSQLTLWGITRLRQLSFDRDGQNDTSCGNLVMLNLWGCYGLRDEAATALGSMTNLRSLIVSECHRLTDEFLVSGMTKQGRTIQYGRLTVVALTFVVRICPIVLTSAAFPCPPFSHLLVFYSFVCQLLGRDRFPFLDKPHSLITCTFGTARKSPTMV